ncbi:MAG: hypothetical protein ACOVQ7_19660 [Limnoraphis robusta]
MISLVHPSSAVLVEESCPSNVLEYSGSQQGQKFFATPTTFSSRINITTVYSRQYF